MRKRIKGRKFGRQTAQRRALLVGITESLFEHGRIKTTVPRAKEVRRIADRAITTGKKGTLASRRRLERTFTSKIAAEIMNTIAPRFQDRAGGYTRIIKAGERKGDRAQIALIELVERGEE